MGITIGDVLTVIALFFGTLVSIWALLVGFAILFPFKAEKARVEAQAHPWRSLVVGFTFSLVLGIIAGALAGNPVPPVKMVGFGVYAFLIGTVLVGGAGVSLIAAGRIQSLERRRGGYRSIERGALLLVVGAILPVFGWFFFAPILLFISAGAGFRALFVRRRQSYSIEAQEPALSGASAGRSAQGAGQEFVV